MVCDIQTDKAVVSMEVDDEGVLAKIIVQADSGSIKVCMFIDYDFNDFICSHYLLCYSGSKLKPELPDIIP